MKRRLLTGLVVGTAGLLAWQTWSLWPEGEDTPVAMTSQTTIESPTTPNAVDTSTATVATLPAETHPSSEQSSAVQPTNGVRVDLPRNTLTVSQQNVRLSTLLQDISHQSNIVFHNMLEIDFDDEMISAELDGVPLETGLRTLLAGYDSFFYYASTAPMTELQSVWVYPLGHGKTVAPVPAGGIASARNDAENSVDEIIDVENLLDLAQNDGDETQRLRALLRLTDTGIVPSRDWLEKVLLSDRSEAMRLEAFHTLMQSMELSTQDMRALANLAMSDTNETLRNEAQQLLTDMNTTALTEPPVQNRNEVP